MLYNPKWEPKKRKRRNWLSRWWWPVTPDEVFEISDFTAWVACQPSTKLYDYSKPTKCAFAQYLQERGVSEWNSMMKDPSAVYPGLSKILNKGCGNTFGELLARLTA